MFLLVSFSSAMAQGMPKFDPARFNQKMQQHIAWQAGLTPKEAEAFFPLYEEMNKKLRALFGELMSLRRIKPSDEKSCRENIRRRDELELQMKEVQQLYHTKFLKVLPASKVYDVIKAEDTFHRQMFRNAKAR